MEARRWATRRRAREHEVAGLGGDVDWHVHVGNVRLGALLEESKLIVPLAPARE